MLDEVKKRHPALRWHVLTGEAVKQLIDQYNSTPPVSNVVADAIMVADVDPDAPQVSITTALRNCVLMSEWINRGQWEATIEHLFGEPSEPLKEDPS
jgi:hypothetical protein